MIPRRQRLTGRADLSGSHSPETFSPRADSARWPKTSSVFCRIRTLRGTSTTSLALRRLPQSRNSLTFKVDQRITASQSLAFSYSMFTNQVYNGSVFGDPTGVLATNYLPVSYRSPRLAYDWIAKPNVVVHAAVGYNRRNRLSY